MPSCQKCGQHKTDRLIAVGPSRCVTGEDEVASFGGLVAGIATLESSLGGGFAVVEFSEPPAAGRGVFACILDHELNPFLGGPGHERLGMAKDFVVFLRRDIIPGETGNDGAVRKWKLAFPVGPDRYVIAQNGTQIVEVACFMGH